MKNVLLISALAAVGLFILPSQSIAQKDSSVTCMLTGSVYDSAGGRSLPFITVTLKTGNAVVKVAVSRDDGSFNFLSVKPGAYRLIVTAVGYRSRDIDVVMPDTARGSYAIGSIGITATSANLKEARVTAARAIIHQDIDGITYNLKADPDSKGYSVLEMIRKVPYLSLDADDNILLKGSTGFKILIDGKPSGMMDKNAKEILRSMPASTIERIEVITIPPAKYDAEGLTGLINIVTTKMGQRGYSGTVNLNERTPTGGPGGGETFNLKVGKLGISTFGGGSIYNVPQQSAVLNRATYGTDPTGLSQQSYSISKSRTGYLGFDLSYELDSLSLLSAQVNLNGYHSNDGLNEQSSLQDPTGVLQQFMQQNSEISNSRGEDATVNYQRGSKRHRSQVFTFSYKYYTSHATTSDNSVFSDTIKYDQPDYRQNDITNFKENTFQVDYVNVIPKVKINVEAGVKGIFRTSTSDYEYGSTGDTGGTIEGDSLGSNNFLNTQDVLAAYNTYQFSIKGWGFKTGIRLEKTLIKGSFAGGGDPFKENFLNAFPSVAVGKKVTKKGSLNFGFTQRIQRPGLYQLNPFVNKVNPDVVYSGDPTLRPIIATLIQTNYSISGRAFISFGLDYAHFQSLIQQVSEVDPTTNITYVSYHNTGHAELKGASFNVSYPVTKAWNISLNSKMAYGIVTGTVDSQYVKTEGVMYNVSFSTGYNFGGGWKANAGVTTSGPTISIQTKTRGYTGSNFGLSKDLVNGKLTLAASANNPFAKFRDIHAVISGPSFQQIDDTQSYFRYFSFRINYNFGKLKQDAIKKNKVGINNDDIPK